MLQNSSEQTQRWEQNHQKKIQLMRQMQGTVPQYQEILGFFEQVLQERKKYKFALCDLPDPLVPGNFALYESKLKKGIPLLDRNDIDFNNQIMAEHLFRLAQILKSRSRNKPADFSDAFLQKNNFNLKTFLTGKQLPLSGDPMDFLVSETINPVLAIYAEKIKDRIDFTKWNRGYCPVCGEFPMMAALSAETGKRKLISLSCGTEWEYSRVKCPYCENEDQQQLSYLYIENTPRYRIEICHQCRQYIKTIDLRQTTEPVDYEIENIITLHLDIIARENGYGDDGSVGETKPENAVYH